MGSMAFFMKIRFYKSLKLYKGLKRMFLLCMAAMLLVCVPYTPVQAEVTISAPSAILVEASTGQIIFEQNSTERRSPASITKIMTILLIFDNLESGKVALEDQVTVSTYASSMGGSQVWLADGEVQGLETLLKCIIVASANDASVAVAEHIAGSEGAFVDMMNAKAVELGMMDTHFTDCCGLTDSDEHYTTARDVALMSRELITKHPDVFRYTQIWQEDFTHQTSRGTSTFTLSSTNKLLKQYDWITGLKTGSTSKAKYCISATGRKNDMDLIAVIMGAPDPKTRFADAATLLNYGYSVCQMYIDKNTDMLPPMPVKGGVEESVPLIYAGEFKYLDTEGQDLGQIEKELEIPEEAKAPVQERTEAGQMVYRLNGKVIGSVPVLFEATVEKAAYKDYLIKILLEYLM